MAVSPGNTSGAGLLDLENSDNDPTARRPMRSLHKEQDLARRSINVLTKNSKGQSLRRNGDVEIIYKQSSVKILEAKTENVHFWKGVMIKALELGYLNNTLAMTCIKILEKWFNLLPVSMNDFS